MIWVIAMIGRPMLLVNARDSRIPSAMPAMPAQRISVWTKLADSFASATVVSAASLYSVESSSPRSVIDIFDLCGVGGRIL